MAQGTCHDCGGTIEVAVWDDGVLSGSVIPLCKDCKSDSPEDTLWDASAIEETHEEWPDGDNPNIISEHPLEESSDWVVRNRYQDRETYLVHIRASWDGKMPDGTFEELDAPDEEHWDIFVRDSSDTQAIEEARDYLRRKKEKSLLRQ